MLAGHELTVDFGGLRALEDVSVALEAHEILGVIGPNGAGKTTLLNVLTGFQRPKAGRLAIGSTVITGAAPERIARLGVARTFQGLGVLPRLTVFENVEIGAVGRRLGRTSARAEAWAALEASNLAARGDAKAEELAYGELRRLGVARAAAMRPSFLLLDEPAAGLNEGETDELAASIRDVKARLDCGVLIVEHDMRFIMGVCDRIQVLDHGRTIANGTPAEVQRSEDVIAAYLGADYQEA